MKRKRSIDWLKEVFSRYNLYELCFSSNGKELYLNHIIFTSNFDYYKIIHNITNDIEKIKITEKKKYIYLIKRYTALTFDNTDSEFIEIQLELLKNRKIIDLADDRMRILNSNLISIRKKNDYYFRRYNGLNFFA